MFGYPDNLELQRQTVIRSASQASLPTFSSHRIGKTQPVGPSGLSWIIAEVDMRTNIIHVGPIVLDMMFGIFPLLSRELHTDLRTNTNQSISSVLTERDRFANPAVFQAGSDGRTPTSSWEL